MSETETNRPDSLPVRTLKGIVGGLIILATALNFANIIARYVLAQPIVWAEEVMQLINVWAVMLGAAIVTRDGTHIQMDFFYNLFPSRGRRALQCLFGLITVVVGGYVILQSARMVDMLASTGQRTVIARLPMAFIYMAVPLGYLLTIVFLPLWLWGRRSPSDASPGASAAMPSPTGETAGKRGGS